MRHIARRWQGFTQRAAIAWVTRRGTAGFQLSAENILWLIIILVVVSAVMYVIFGAGVPWAQDNLHRITSIQPTNTPGSIPVTG